MSDDRLVVLDHRDTHVRLDGRALRIDGPEGLRERVPLGLVGQVVVIGSPSVSCDVWRALAERGISAVLLPARGTGAIAWLGAGLPPALRLRRLQHLAAARPDAHLPLARRLVSLKLAGYQRLAQRLAAGELAGPWDDPQRIATGATDVAHRIGAERRALREARDVAGLMGHEGVAAAAWWRWLSDALPAHWGFRGRNRRPPRDPVNALLSLGYTLLGSEVRRHVHAHGLDPALGLLHDIYPGREALVLDLVEPLRAGVDAFALSLLDRGPDWGLTPQDFTTSEHDGCRLGKAARGLFFSAWATWRQDWPLASADPDGLPPEGAALPRACRRLLRHLTRRLEQAAPRLGLADDSEPTNLEADDG
jgi:CRISPR-associated protein Cas1